jgi:hypothetical protein
MSCPCCGPQCCLPATINATVSGVSGYWVHGCWACFDGSRFAPYWDPPRSIDEQPWTASCPRPSDAFILRQASCFNRNYGGWGANRADDWCGSYAMTTVGCGTYQGELPTTFQGFVNIACCNAPILCGGSTVPRINISASVDRATQIASITISILGPQSAIQGGNLNTFVGTKPVDLSGGCPADISGSYTLTPDRPWLTNPDCGNPPEQFMVVTIS